MQNSEEQSYYNYHAYQVLKGLTSYFYACVCVCVHDVLCFSE